MIDVVNAVKNTHFQMSDVFGLYGEKVVQILKNIWHLGLKIKFESSLF